MWQCTQFLQLQHQFNINLVRIDKNGHASRPGFNWNEKVATITFRFALAPTALMPAPTRLLLPTFGQDTRDTASGSVRFFHEGPLVCAIEIGVHRRYFKAKSGLSEALVEVEGGKVHGLCGAPRPLPVLLVRNEALQRGDSDSVVKKRQSAVLAVSKNPLHFRTTLLGWHARLGNVQCEYTYIPDVESKGTAVHSNPRWYRAISSGNIPVFGNI
ncbi:hypothetical protein C8R46DRAFT_1040612 [Mycena filopes]|nr:hypothetical protein C8R46DRAFT_1040612 [Mycena filopes]